MSDTASMTDVLIRILAQADPSVQAAVAQVKGDLGRLVGGGPVATTNVGTAQAAAAQAGARAQIDASRQIAAEVQRSQAAQTAAVQQTAAAELAAAEKRLAELRAVGDAGKVTIDQAIEQLQLEERLVELRERAAAEAKQNARIVREAQQQTAGETVAQRRQQTQEEREAAAAAQVQMRQRVADEAAAGAYQASQRAQQAAGLARGAAATSTSPEAQAAAEASARAALLASAAEKRAAAEAAEAHVQGAQRWQQAATEAAEVAIREAQRAANADKSAAEQAAAAAEQAAAAAEKAAAQRAAAEEKAASAARASAHQTFSRMHSDAMQAGIAFGIIAAGFGKIGQQIVQQTIAWDIYQTKLATVLHSTTQSQEEIRQLVQISFKVPFSLSSLVDADVKLRIFGQDAKSLIGPVGELAAAMGTDINQAAVAVAKSLEGSQLGVRELTNTFGISRVQLKEYGAAMNSQGGILLHTSAQVDAFRHALMKIINDLGAGGMARRMQTLAGQFTNIEAAWQNLTRSLGQSVEPVLISAVGAFSSLLQVAAEVPAPIMALAMAAGGGAFALASMGAAVNGAIFLLPMLAKGLGVTEAALESATAASGALGLAQATLQGALANTATALRAVTAAAAANPIVAIGVAILAAEGMIATAIDLYQQKLKLADLVTSEQAAHLQALTLRWRGLQDAIEGATGAQGQFVVKGGDLNKVLANIHNAMKHMTPEQVSNMLAKSGVDLAMLEKQHAEAAKSASRLLPDVEILQKAYNADFTKINPLDAHGKMKSQPAILEEEQQRRGDIERGMALLKTKGHPSPTDQDLENELTLRKRALENVQKTLAATDDTIRSMHKLGAGTEDADKQMKALRDTTQALSILPSAASAHAQLQVAERVSKDLAGRVRTATGTTNVNALLGKLANSGESDQNRALIKNYLESLAAVADAKKAILDRDLQNVDNYAAREQAAGTADLAENVRIAQRHVDILKGSGENMRAQREQAYANLLSAQRAYNKQQDDLALQAIARQLTLDLAAAGDSKRKKIAAYERASNAIRRAEADSVDGQLSDTRAGEQRLQAVRDAASALRIQRAKDAANRETDVWLKAQDHLLARLKSQPYVGADAIAATLDAQARDARARAASTTDEAQRKRLQDRAAERDTAAAEQRNQMLRKALDIEEHILQVRKQEDDRDIKALGARLAKGEDVQDQILARVKERLAYEDEAIDRQAAKKLAAVGADAQAQRDIQEEAAAARLRARDDEKASLDQMIAGLKRARESAEEAYHHKFDRGRMGGPQSPLQSAAEAFGDNIVHFQGVHFQGVNFGIGGKKPAAPVDRLQAFSDALGHDTKDLGDALRQNRTSIDSNTKALDALPNALQAVLDSLKTGASHPGVPSPEQYGVKAPAAQQPAAAGAAGPSAVATGVSGPSPYGGQQTIPAGNPASVQSTTVNTTIHMGTGIAQADPNLNEIAKKLGQWLAIKHIGPNQDGAYPIIL